MNPVKSIPAIAIALFAAQTVQAAPIAVTNYNGHQYSLYEAPGITWADASAAAAGVSSNSYLAVFGDLGETESVYAGLIGNGFFTTTTSQSGQAWLGARPADGSSSTTDPNNWAWTNGETWTAFNALNFAPGEPNGDSSGLAINRYGSSMFNDEGGFVGGYIVESAVRVPEGGSAVALMGIAIGGLAFFRRKLA